MIEGGGSKHRPLFFAHILNPMNNIYGVIYMRAKKNRDNRKQIKKLLILFSIMFALIALILFADRTIRPVITSFSQYKVKRVASEIINRAIVDEFVDNKISYDSLVHISRLDSGAVSSIVADTSLMNRIKADLLSTVLKNINNQDSLYLKIPIGSLSGIQLLSGMGPTITIKILPSSTIDANFTSEFESVGINQTLHKISIHFVIEITAIIPGYTSTSKIDTDVAIAETVIVGLIPETVIDIGGEKSIASKFIEDKK